MIERKSTVCGAVLLAAGRGSRLKPHTNSIPKPLLPVNGKPTLDLYFEGLRAAGVSDTVLVTHHLAELVESYAQDVPARFGIKCATIEQPQLDGTASALQSVINQVDGAVQGEKSIVKQVIGSSFLLMATDYLIPPNFIEDLLAFHVSHSAAVTVSLKRVPEAELASRSSARFDEEGRILEIVEKPLPGTAPSDLAANLAFVLPADLCAYVSDVKGSIRGEREVQSAINAYLADGGTCRGLIQGTPDEWSPERNL